MIDEKLWKHQCELIHAMDDLTEGDIVQFQIYETEV